MNFTITEAAKLYGKQRKTLYRHIDSGRISAGFRGDGKRVIDLAELIRCYGEPPNAPAANDTKKTRDTPQGDTLLTRALLDEMRQQTATIERMADRIERLEAALLRLPPPSASTEPEPATPPPPKASNPPRDFSDLLARFEARTRH